MRRFKHCNSLATEIRMHQKENNEIVWRELLAELKFSCQEYRIDFSLFGINEYPTTPQLPTADLILPAVTENQWPMTADVQLAAATENSKDITTANVPVLEIDQTSVTAFIPPQIIQFSRANKCKLETCLNDADGKIYCSDKCRIKFNNLKRSTKSA